MEKMLLTRITTKTREEVAAEYQISVRTLYRWLKRAEIRLPPGRIRPKELKRIYEAFGWPVR